MTVRMFAPRFAALVESGAKTQTVRPTPKRLPAVGDVISLRAWSGSPYRSKQRVLREATVAEVLPVRITQVGISVDHSMLWDDGLLRFARADGFDSWPDMLEWFRQANGVPFEGILIRWR